MHTKYSDEIKRRNEIRVIKRENINHQREKKFSSHTNSQKNYKTNQFDKHSFLNDVSKKIRKFHRKSFQRRQQNESRKISNHVKKTRNLNANKTNHGRQSIHQYVEKKKQTQ